MVHPSAEPDEARAALRALVRDALRDLAAGRLPAERASMDLKEESGRRGRGGVLLPGEPRNLAAADSLADAVACMANSPGGGAILVGAEDGTGQLLGTALDVEWLRHRVWERVDVAPAVEEHVVAGVRLLALLVAEAREPVEDTSGQLRWRVADACVPVDRSEWWLQRQERSGHDPLAAASSSGESDIAGSTLELVRRYAAEQLAPATAARDLLVRLGALRPDGQLTRAAARLLCPSPTTDLTLTVLDVEGGSVLAGPPDLSGRSVLEQLATIEERLDVLNTAVPVRAGFTETPVRSLPPLAVREALCNALVHRDWFSADPVEAVWVQADAALTVTSPGGFVGQVNPENALTERYARSPALADLFRSVRLVEKQGLGIDRMVRDMVSLGHRPPRVAERAGPTVRVRLSGGPPVVPVMELVSRVQPEVRRRDVRVALVLHALLTEPYVMPHLLRPVLQREADECLEAILVAADCRVQDMPLLVELKGTWQLSPAALDVIERGPDRLRGLQAQGLMRYRRPSSAESLVARWLRDHDQVTSGDVAALTGLTPAGALGQLDRLVVDNVLLRGAARGRAAHFLAGPSFRPAPPPVGLLTNAPVL